MLCSARIAAQPSTYHHIGVVDGLSHYSALSIYVDERDLIWVGTSDGLNLWSGYDFTVFKTDPNNPESLFCDNIQRVTGNGNGKIWIQTINGVAEFDIGSNSFTTICTGNDYRICSSGDELYIGQGHSIFRVHDCTVELVYSLCDTSVSISALYADAQRHILLVGTSHHGLYKLEQRPDDAVEESRLIDSVNVSEIYSDSSGRYWVGTNNDGVYMSDNGLHSFRNFRHDSHNPNSIGSNFVRTFCEDAHHTIYIGTFDGFNTYNPDDGMLHCYSSLGSYADIGYRTAIESTSVWSIACDRQNNIWIGTYFEGLYYFNPEYNIYRKISASDNERNGLSSPIVSGITEDRNGNLYIATEAGGFCRYDRRADRFEWIRHLNALTLDNSYDNIKSLYYDRTADILWLGTHMGGLFRYDPRTGRLRQFSPPHTHHSTSRIVRQILPWKDRLLLATHAGLWCFDPATETFDRMPGIDQTGIISELVLSRDGRSLWLAGNKPLLYRYDFDQRRMVSYRFSSEETLAGNLSATHLCEDSSGNIWVGTENDGIYIFNTVSTSFEHIDNLTNNKICSIAELADGRFIITTSNGLNLFDYKRHSIIKQQANRELPLSMLNQDALFVASDSTIYAGGIDGMISFRIDQLPSATPPTHIFPMRLTIDGRNQPLHMLPDGHNTGDALIVAPRHSVITVKYAIPNLSFTSADLQYCLSGHGADEWFDMPNDNTVTLINLQPDRYTLQVRIIDKNGELLSMHSFAMRIRPPWYGRWWAYALFALTAIVLMAIVFRIHTYHIELRASLEYERKKRLDQEELGNSKLRFFTNVAHEFRTPLTVIIGHIESLLQSHIFESRISRKLKLIHKSASNLQQLADELLDFRKHEQGYMKIHAEKHDIIKFLRELSIVYREYAATQNITLQFRPETEQLFVWYDAVQLQKVFNNLLSNAIKYIECEHGRITLTASREDQWAVIRVEDNGKGIPASEIEDIFQRFYRTDTVHVGSGIGLSLTKGIVERHGGRIEVESVEHQGSVFTVRLPLGCSHLTGEQIVSMPAAAQIETQIPDTVDDTEDDTLENGGGGKFKMLIAEDNEELQALFGEIFGDMYQVVIANDGAQALDIMKHFTPDIIVSDIVMPNMNGFEFCKAVKSNFETSHIPFIALTAYASTANNIRGFQLGADDYIAKPFNTNILISRCNNLINSRLAMREKFSGQQHVEPQNLVYTSLDKQFIEQAMKVIEAHIDNPQFNITLFAKEMSIARTKLFAKMKAISGQTPSEFIRTIKLQRAAELLVNNPEYNVSDICELLGFSTPRYFSTCFKQKYGISPLQYRQRRGRLDDNSDV